MVPLEHCHQEVCQDLIHEDYLNLAQLVLSFQKKKMALVPQVPCQTLTWIQVPLDLQVLPVLQDLLDPLVHQDPLDLLVHLGQVPLAQT